MPPIALIWLLLLSVSFHPLATGVQGPAVSALQTELSRLHLNPGPIDGVYGPDTAAAVNRLEVSAGLPADGQAGAAVLADIVAKIGASAPLLQSGAKGPAVRDLQALLTADGIKVETDGTFGAATVAAVRQLQTARGLASDGIVGPETWASLFERSYTVQPGQTIDGIAAMFGLSSASLLASNGGTSLIVAGQRLELPYAGVPVALSSAPTASQPSPQPAPGATPANGTGSSTSKDSGGGKVIPGRTLAQWGGAGTPQLGVIVLAEDQASALALRQSMPAGMILALPASLFSLAGQGQVLLATSEIADVERTGAKAVLWQGPLSAGTLQRLKGVSVLVARQEPPGQALAAASGGELLAVPIAGGDLSTLKTLAQSLTRAGYRLTSPLD